MSERWDARRSTERSQAWPALGSAAGAGAASAVLEEIVSGGAWVFDPAPATLSLSHGASQLLRLPRHPIEIAGCFERVIASDRARLAARLRRTLRSGAATRIEVTLAAMAGGGRIMVAAKALGAPDAAFLVGAVLDVTGRRRAEQDLTAATLAAFYAAPQDMGIADAAPNSVGDSVSTAAAPLPAPPGPGNDAAAAAFERFAAAAAHDVQAPLRKLLVYAELAKRCYQERCVGGVDTDAAAEIEAYLDTIARSAERLRTVIARWSDAAETEAERFPGAGAAGLDPATAAALARAAADHLARLTDGGAPAAGA